MDFKIHVSPHLLNIDVVALEKDLREKHNFMKELIETECSQGGFRKTSLQGFFSLHIFCR